MKKIFVIAAGLAFLASCAEEMTSVQPGEDEVIVEAYLPGDDVPVSKVILTEESNNDGNLMINVDWASSGESFSVMTATSGYSETFTQFGPRSFRGKLPANWQPTYYAFYPVTISKTPTSIDYDISNQKGTLENNNPYMYATSWGGTIYNFNHLTALVKLSVNMPEGHVGTPTKIMVSSNKLQTTGSIDLTTTAPTIHGSGNIITFPAQTAGLSSYTVYMYVNPMVASADNQTTFKVEIPESNARYSGSFSTSKTIERGKVYEASLTLSREENVRLENPTDLFVDQIDETSAYLYWKDNNSNEGSYRAYKKLNDKVNTADHDANTEIHTFNYLNHNEVLYLGAQALSSDVNIIGHSETVYSRPYRVLNWEELQEFNADYWQDEPDTWTGVYRECIAPEGLKVTGNNNGKITIEWKCGSAQELGFNLYARPVSETAWHKKHLKTFVEGANKETGTITVTSGTSYFLGVQTKGATGARNSNIIMFYNTNTNDGSVKAN